MRKRSNGWRKPHEEIRELGEEAPGHGWGMVTVENTGWRWRRGSCRKVWGDTQKHSVNQITEFGLCPADNGESTASSEKNVDIYSFLGKLVLWTLRRMNLTSCEKKGLITKRLVTWVIIRIHEKDDTEGRMEWVKIKMKFFVQWEKKIFDTKFK